MVKHINGIREVTKKNYKKGIKTASLFVVKLKENVMHTCASYVIYFWIISWWIYLHVM